jgi:hypothetical protein
MCFVYFDFIVLNGFVLFNYAGLFWKVIENCQFTITIIKWSPDGSYLITGNYLSYKI